MGLTTNKLQKKRLLNLKTEIKIIQNKAALRKKKSEK